MGRHTRALLAGLFSAVVFANCAARAEGAASPYDPPVGSRWTITSQGREEKTQDGTAAATITFTRKEELNFVEKAAPGYRISAVLRSYDWQGDKMAGAANALLGALRDVVVRAVVDQNGKPARIENLDEVVAAHKQGFESMVATFNDKPEVAAKLRQLLGTILTEAARDPANAAQWYLETVALLSIAQNTGLGVGEERQKSKTSPNPFGGDPIKTNTTLRLVEADPATGKVKLVRTEAYDPVALKEFTISLAKKLVSDVSSEQLEKIMSQMSMSMDDRTEFIVENGMTRSVAQETLTSVKAMGHAVSKRAHNEVSVTPLP